MTTHTDNDSNVLKDPLKHIGAQDISGLRGGCTKNGFLRRQGRLERFFKFLTWRQRYVVIAQGCLYIFKNELSRSYIMAVSLKSYNKTIRSTAIQRMPFVFRVLPHDPVNGNVLVFSCPDEANQKRWMAAIKKDLLKANDVAAKDIDDDLLDDYIYIEKDVGTIKKELEEANKEELDPEKDYSVIKDMDLGHRRGPFPTAQTTSSLPTPQTKSPVYLVQQPKASTFAATHHTTDRNNKPVSPVLTSKTNNKHFKKPMATPKNRIPSGNESDDEKPVIERKSYEYNGTDRTKVEDILLSKPEGTFLIRTSRSDDREVLSINVADSLKEYKIYIREGQCTIDNKMYFSSTDELLLYYHEHNLPNKTVKLKKAYLLQSAGYVNQRYTPSQR